MINIINNPLIVITGTFGIMFIVFLIFKKRFFRDWRKSIFHEKMEFIILALLFLTMFILGVFQVPFSHPIAMVCGAIIVSIVILMIYTKKARKKFDAKNKTLEGIYGIKLEKPKGSWSYLEDIK